MSLGEKRMTAVVVMGEAPESEEEETDEIDAAVIESKFNDGLHVRPETPPSPSPDFHHQPSHQLKDSLQRSPPTDTQLIGRSKMDSSLSSYDTLLHRKLREKNELLREELIKVACQPYLNATREIDSLSQQLIKSQKMVQQVSGTLQKLTKDLKNVELSLDAYRVADSTIIPQFTHNLVHKASSPHRKHEPDSKSDASPSDKLLT